MKVIELADKELEALRKLAQTSHGALSRREETLNHHGRNYAKVMDERLLIEGVLSALENPTPG